MKYEEVKCLDEKEFKQISTEEFDRLWEDSKKYNSGLALVAALLDCGYRDADEVLRLIDVHGSEVVDEARDFHDSVGGTMNFGSIIEGVKRTVQDRLRALIENEEELELYDEWINELIIDDNYIAWGGVYSYGSCPEDVGSAFTEIMSQGHTEENEEDFITAFREAVESS